MSCFDIGVLDYDSTPLHTRCRSDRLKSVSIRIAKNLKKRGVVFRLVRKKYGVDIDVVAENLKNRRITSDTTRRISVAFISSYRKRPTS